jgi:hypothetical protein
MDHGDGIPRDANGYRYDEYPAARAELHQQILNQSWPERDAGGFHARNIHDQPVDRHLDVTVRVVFERDGEVLIPGRATRWNRSHVFVTAINDPRVPRPGVWVLARDVRRR